LPRLEGYFSRERSASATGIPAHQGYLHESENEPDNRILECDVAGYARAKATGDSATLEPTCAKLARRSRKLEINHFPRFRGLSGVSGTRVSDPQHTRNALVYNALRW
jgi:hypothetical protein